MYLKEVWIQWWWAGRGAERELYPPHVGLVVGVAAPPPQLGAKIRGHSGEVGEKLLNPAQGEGTAVARIPDHTNYVGTGTLPLPLP